MAATTVLGAIEALIRTDGTIGTLCITGPSDNPFTGQIPEGKALPGIALVHNGETVPRWTNEKNYLEETELDVEIFALTAAAVEQLQLAVKAALNWDTVLTITGASVTKIERGKYLLSPDLFRDASGEIVFKGSISYTVMIERTAY
jgi:hypothetical protein